jgi:hypothetical protein
LPPTKGLKLPHSSSQFSLCPLKRPHPLLWTRDRQDRKGHLGLGHAIAYVGRDATHPQRVTTWRPNSINHLPPPPSMVLSCLCRSYTPRRHSTLPQTLDVLEGSSPASSLLSDARLLVQVLPPRRAPCPSPASARPSVRVAGSARMTSRPHSVSILTKHFSS